MFTLSLRRAGPAAARAIAWESATTPTKSHTSRVNGVIFGSLIAILVFLCMMALDRLYNPQVKRIRIAPWSGGYSLGTSNRPPLQRLGLNGDPHGPSRLYRHEIERLKKQIRDQAEDMVILDFQWQEERTQAEEAQRLKLQKETDLVRHDYETRFEEQAADFRRQVSNITNELQREKHERFRLVAERDAAAGEAENARRGHQQAERERDAWEAYYQGLYEAKELRLREDYRADEKRLAKSVQDHKERLEEEAARKARQPTRKLGATKSAAETPDHGSQAQAQQEAATSAMEEARGTSGLGSTGQHQHRPLAPSKGRSTVVTPTWERKQPRSPKGKGRATEVKLDNDRPADSFKGGILEQSQQNASTASVSSIAGNDMMDTTGASMQSDGCEKRDTGLQPPLDNQESPNVAEDEQNMLGLDEEPDKNEDRKTEDEGEGESEKEDDDDDDDKVDVPEHKASRPNDEEQTPDDEADDSDEDDGSGENDGSGAGGAIAAPASASANLLESVDPSLSMQQQQQPQQPPQQHPSLDEDLDMDDWDQVYRPGTPDEDLPPAPFKEEQNTSQWQENIPQLEQMSSQFGDMVFSGDGWTGDLNIGQSSQPPPSTEAPSLHEAPTRDQEVEMSDDCLLEDHFTGPGYEAQQQANGYSSQDQEGVKTAQNEVHPTQSAEEEMQDIFPHSFIDGDLSDDDQLNEGEQPGYNTQQPPNTTADQIENTVLPEPLDGLRTQHAGHGQLPGDGTQQIPSEQSGSLGGRSNSAPESPPDQSTTLQSSGDQPHWANENLSQNGESTASLRISTTESLDAPDEDEDEELGLVDVDLDQDKRPKKPSEEESTDINTETPQEFPQASVPTFDPRAESNSAQEKDGARDSSNFFGDIPQNFKFGRKVAKLRVRSEKEKEAFQKKLEEGQRREKEEEELRGRKAKEEENLREFRRRRDEEAAAERVRAAEEEESDEDEPTSQPEPPGVASRWSQPDYQQAAASAYTVQMGPVGKKYDPFARIGTASNTPSPARTGPVTRPPAPWYTSLTPPQGPVTAPPAFRTSQLSRNPSIQPSKAAHTTPDDKDADQGMSDESDEDEGEEDNSAANRNQPSGTHGTAFASNKDDLTVENKNKDDEDDEDDVEDECGQCGGFDNNHKPDCKGVAPPEPASKPEQDSEPEDCDDISEDDSEDDLTKLHRMEFPDEDPYQSGEDERQD
ncbi:Hypothetical predicted protein [Lecanosticta acicola]|uniref:Uncharacterized protein n=1 Tax=Lecanosticta acicola TaxID=111012 RepID=A0AAI8Z030_9PEZI|nr:Hypothetical predicted protein [Lecanosticta acicola]